MQITEASYIKSSANYTQCPAADKPEYAFIGRSNVGKSSLINMLCNKKALAKTSSAPGKTQLINHFLINAGAKKPFYKEKRRMVPSRFTRIWICKSFAKATQKLEQNDRRLYIAA